ncbi:hypothetical protein B0H13DRAFT_345309 [Mycena leptocephala]|nr:hypothetical protein B0H13DRAFT_345309 [Mycena leptocephala]
MQGPPLVMCAARVRDIRGDVVPIHVLANDHLATTHIRALLPAVVRRRMEGFQIPAALAPAPPAPSPAASKKWTLWSAPSFPLRYMEGPHTLLVLHGSARVYRCRATSAIGTTSIVPTPRLPPPTAATRGHAPSSAMNAVFAFVRRSSTRAQLPTTTDNGGTTRGYSGIKGMERGAGERSWWTEKDGEQTGHGVHGRCISAAAHGLARYTEGEESERQSPRAQYRDARVPTISGIRVPSESIDAGLVQPLCTRSRIQSLMTANDTGSRTTAST